MALFSVGVGVLLLVFSTAGPASASGAWSIQSTPNPAFSHSSYLTGVSCPAPTTCIAVGYYASSAGGYLTLAERWNGTSWSILSTPNPTGAKAYLDAVSCSSATACTAVGDSYTTSVGHDVTLAERWNGTSWAIESTFSPAGVASTLQGVSCASATACMAVGSDSVATVPSTLAERWNGSSWAKTTTPNPAGLPGGSLSGVSCSSSTACTAVGSGFEYIAGATLAERWNGTSWSIQTTPNATSAGTVSNVLSAVSCDLATACTAVGNSNALFAGSSALAEGWNGTNWGIKAAANPALANLGGVSCSGTVCLAAGHYYSPSLTVAELWNGSSWTVQPSPNPTGTTASYLDAVSCSSASACTAVGTATNSTGTAFTLAERY